MTRIFAALAACVLLCAPRAHAQGWPGELSYPAAGGARQTVDAAHPLPVAGRGPATPTQTSVNVPSSQSTQLIGANSTRRGLQIIPEGANTTCSINDSGGAAVATSKPIPGGWSYTELDPPPATAVTAFCTTAGAISVTELN